MSLAQLSGHPLSPDSPHWDHLDGASWATRAPTPVHRARFVLVRFRERCDIARLGVGFGLSRATAYRHLDQAACVPLERVVHDKVHLILDGTTIACDRPAGAAISVKGKEIDSRCGGKAHDFGGNAQALTDPRGAARWIPDVPPGHPNDPNTARQPVLAIVRPYTKGMPVLADGGYNGAGRGMPTPAPQRADGIPPHVDQRTCSKLLRGLRRLAERWKALRHVTMSPPRTTDLTHFEHGLIS
jgi:DDE superfamily endonuclease